MGRQHTAGLTLDAGALVAIERADRLLGVLIQRARELGDPIIVPAGALAQVWRDGSRLARLSSLLGSASVQILALTPELAKASGALCGRRGTTDVIDASVVLTARRFGGRVVTSDPEDIRLLDPELIVVRV